MYLFGYSTFHVVGRGYTHTVAYIRKGPTNFVAGVAEADYTVRVNRSETTDGGTFKDHVVVVPVKE